MNTSQQRTWKPNPMILKTVKKDQTAIEKFINPETVLEQRITQDKAWLEGAFWGTPRPGHPEGKIIYHIHEVLANVDKATQQSSVRQQLRLIAIIHDTFKHLEEKVRPRTDWTKHHAVYASTFAQKYIKDKAVINVIKHHDEAFYAWRSYCFGNVEASEQRMNQLIENMGEALQLFYLFFKCDTQTGDKYQAPVAWFEQKVKGIRLIKF